MLIVIDVGVDGKILIYMVIYKLVWYLSNKVIICGIGVILRFGCLIIEFFLVVFDIKFY